jgi:hypothetical protein
MIASHHGKIAPAVWKCALFDVLDPCAINADRDLMFAFAGDRASMATDTFAVINYESKGRHERGLSYIASFRIYVLPLDTATEAAANILLDGLNEE